MNEKIIKRDYEEDDWEDLFFFLMLGALVSVFTVLVLIYVVVLMH